MKQHLIDFFAIACVGLIVYQLNCKVGSGEIEQILASGENVHIHVENQHIRSTDQLHFVFDQIEQRYCTVAICIAQSLFSWFPDFHFVRFACIYPCWRFCSEAKTRRAICYDILLALYYTWSFGL
jgi:hypothetical protein